VVDKGAMVEAEPISGPKDQIRARARLKTPIKSCHSKFSIKCAATNSYVHVSTGARAGAQGRRTLVPPLAIERFF
jgi:hypothetical protein